MDRNELFVKREEPSEKEETKWVALDCVSTAA